MGIVEKSVVGGYNWWDLIILFLVVFLLEDLKYVVFVMLDELKGMVDIYWYVMVGWNVVFLVGNVIRKIGFVLGINLVFEEIEL